MAREKQFTEEEAIQRCTQAFWQKGYNACSVGDLVAASGLSRSSLYDTFGDKAQLFARCLAQYGQQMKCTVEAYAQDKQNPLEKIEAVLLMPFREQAAGNCKGCLAVNTMGELDGAPAEFQEIITNTQKELEEFLAVCIQEGQENGSLIRTESPAALAAMLYTFMCGLLVLHKATPDEQPLIRQVSLLLELIKS